MTIDGVDIETFNARQWNVSMGFCEISNSSEWLEDSLTPLMLESTTGFKKIKVSVMIRGSTRQEILRNASNLIARLKKPAVITLEGFENSFYVYLKNAEEAETCLNRWHKAELEFYGYEYGKEVSVSTSAKTLAVTCEGNIDTPAVVEITPLIGLESVTVTGIVQDPLTGADKPVTIKKLTKNKKIIIDGETGLVTEAGVNKFSDTELWDLPVLKPGLNTITVNKDVTLTIKYKPRYI